MKRLVLLSLVLTAALTGCQKNEIDTEPFTDNTNETVSIRQCATMDILDQKLKDDPTLADRMSAIEAFTQKTLSDRSIKRLLPDGTIEIPVVFNIIYRTSTENISAAQIQSQIDVLNEDYGATNADYSLTPGLFQPVRSGPTGITFTLAAVNRKATTKRSWKVDDSMKSSSLGGIDATAPATNLNIWVVNKMTSNGSTILGYAQFPGGAAATDGVVLGYNFTGRVGTLSPPYHKGRTATHEVGHYLNLRHIWGDATCGNDQVSDTPLHNTANYGCPAAGHLSTCTGTPVEMTMNYMDYTDDPCMYMFSSGQKTRMQAIFVSGGPRNSLAQP